MVRSLVGIGVFSLALAVGGGASVAQDAPPDWDDVGALFAERCVMCHSGEAPPLKLRLDSYENALAGSQDGPVLVAGQPDGSELVRRIRGESQPRMPFGLEPLSAEQITMVERWVAAGLPGPGAAAPPTTPTPPDAPPLSETEQQGRADEPAAPDAAAGAPQGAALPGPTEPVTFAHVEPIFMQRCVMCHSDAAAQPPPEGLRLDSYENVIHGGERVVVLPGNADDSELVRRIEGRAQPRMPFNGPPWLSDEQIELIRRWISERAPDKEGNPAPVPVGREVRVRGTMTGDRSIDTVEFEVGPDTRIEDRPAVGQAGEMRGVVEANGTIRATRLRDR